MSSLQRKLANAVRRNVGLKIASLVIALVLWVYVQSIAALPVVKKFHLSYAQLDTSQWTITGSKPAIESVTAEGSTEALQGLSKWPDDGFVAEVDFRNVQAGVNTYRVTPQRDQIRDYDIRYQNPDPIMLTIEPKITSPPKKVLVVSIHRPDGYTDSEAVTPETVTLSGPESAVNKVTQVVAQVDLKDYKAGQVYSVPVSLLDSRNNQVADVIADPSKVNVHPVLLEVQDIKNVPIELNWTGSLGDYELDGTPTTDPPQATLKGDPQTLSQIAMAETEPIDLSGLTRDTSKRVRLKALPRGVRTDLRTIKVYIRLVHRPPSVVLPSTPSTNPPVSSSSVPGP